MRVLLSIKPEFAEKILNGQKHFEFRKSIFKRDVTTVVIYSTMPVGLVVGEFDIKEIIQDSPAEVWKITKDLSGISESFFDSYFESRSKAYAIQIGEVRRYSHPKYLSDIIPTKAFAPQSYRYLS